MSSSRSSGAEVTFGLERIRALCAVADYGSISAAARMLHVTPSGVSQQLTKLEREIGVPLLVQVGRGVQLTQAGRLLAKRGNEILSLIAQAKAEAVSLEKEVTGELIISSFVSAGRVVVPEAISRLRQLHPSLEVRFVADDSDDIVDTVVRREVDLALVDEWETMPLRLPGEVVAVRMHQDYADVALPTDHPLATAEVIDLAMLSDIPWATWSKGENFHSWLVQTLRKRNLAPRLLYEVPDFAGQLEFVARGLSAALLPRLARVWVPDGVALIPVRPVLRREIYAVYRRDNDLPSVRAATDLLARIFDSIGHPELVPTGSD